MGTYEYLKVIQQNWGYGHGWEDVDAHPCNSRGSMTRKDRAALRENLKAYRENQPTIPVRTVTRRIPRENLQG